MKIRIVVNVTTWMMKTSTGMKFDDIDEIDQMIGFHNAHGCDVTHEENVDLRGTYIHNNLFPLEINKLHNLPNLAHILYSLASLNLHFCFKTNIKK
jgi:hypothetical protein